MATEPSLGARHAVQRQPQLTGQRGSRRVVVVDHYDSYTYNLVHLVAEVTGELPEVVEHDAVSVDDLLDARFTHYVLSPGPGHPANPDDFAVGADLLQLCERPVLGVCLGMQGMVTAYGGLVGRTRPAHGEVSEIEHDGSDLFTGIPSPFHVVRYHSLAALDVPEALKVTAWTGGIDGVPVVMGVQHRYKPQLGVQFHPESILTEHGRALVANFLEVT